MPARFQQAFGQVVFVLDRAELAEQRADVAFVLQALKGEAQHMDLGLHPGETILQVLQGFAKLPLLRSNTQSVPLTAAACRNLLV